MTARTYAPIIAGTGGVTTEQLDALPVSGTSFLGVSSAGKHSLLAGLTATEINAAIAAAIASPPAPSVAPLVLGTNLVEQRNGTNGQRLRVAKTWTSATSFEQFEIDSSSDASNFDLVALRGSAGGVARGIRIGARQDGGSFVPWLTLSNLDLTVASGTVLTSGSVGVGVFTINNDGNSRWSFNAGEFLVAGRMRPTSNNTRALGSGSTRFSTVFTTNLDSIDLTLTPSVSRTLDTNRQFTVERVSDTALNLVYRGNDGTTRRTGVPMGATLSDSQMFVYGAARTTEVVSTPTGTTQTIDLGAANLRTVSLASTTGNLVLTLTVPASSAAGSIIIVNHGTTPRSVTFAVSAGTIVWHGTQPNSSLDAINSSRVYSWRYNGSVMRLFPTEVGS